LYKHSKFTNKISTVSRNHQLLLQYFSTNLDKYVYFSDIATAKLVGD